MVNDNNRLIIEIKGLETILWRLKKYWIYSLIPFIIVFIIFCIITFGVILLMRRFLLM